MESFPLFFRIRAITFTCIILFSFLWLVLLCLEVFTRWSASDQISRSLMILFVLTNTITLIVLPMLILVQFRIWLDAARLLLLFLLQVGSAVAGTFWSPKIQCPNQTPDDIGVCQLIGVYTMMACWIIPAICFYSTYFAVVVLLQSRIPIVVEPQRFEGDLEKGSTDSFSLWREKVNEIIRNQGSNSDGSDSRRSLPHLLVSQYPSAISPLPQDNSQSILSLHPESSRHRSLPAFDYGNKPHHRPLLTLSVARPVPQPLHPQTPSSHSCSTLSSAKPQCQSFSVGASITNAQSSKANTRHLSMMPLSSSSREMRSAEGSPTIRPTRARLSKPPPAHFM